MKKLVYIIALIISIAQISSLHSKNYQFLKDVKPDLKTCQICAEIWPALLFSPNELEVACDVLNQILKDNASIAAPDLGTGGPDNIIGANIWASEELLQRATIRIILAKEDDEFKWREHNSLNDHKATLRTKRKEQEALAHKREIEKKEKEKNRF